MQTASPIPSALVRPRKASIRVAFQYDVQVGSSFFSLAEFEEAVEIVKAWVAEKHDCVSGELHQPRFLYDQHGEKVRWESQSEPHIWALRIVTPDTPPPWQPEAVGIPGRTWTTDLALWQDSATQRLRLTIKILCASRPPYEEAPLVFTRPQCVLRLLEKPGLVDVRELKPTAWEPTSRGELKRWWEDLRDGKFQIPVLVLAPNTDASEVDTNTRHYAADADALAKTLAGLVHVLRLSPQAVAWAAELGPQAKGLLPPGACRLFPAKTQFLDAAFAQRSRLWHYTEMLHWVSQSPSDDPLLNIGPKAFARELGQFIRQQIAQTPLSLSSPFPDVHTVYLAEEARQRASLNLAEQAESMQLALAEKDIQLKEKSDEANEYAAWYDAIEAELRAEKEITHNLLARAHALEAQLRALGSQLKSEHPLPPATLTEFPEAIRKHFPDRIFLHPRAEKSLKTADYEDVARAWRAVLLLANDYYQMRTTHEADREAFLKRVAEEGFEFSRSISPTEAGKYEADYYVQYQKNNQWLKWHLKHGTSRETRYCFRLYFFWDETQQICVIGDMPRHLKTSQS